MKNMQKLDVTKLKEFENHPYKVKHDDEMELLIDSIKEHGILSPIIARPLENGEYEIISGHRRLFASKRAGLTEVPALVVEMVQDYAHCNRLCYYSRPGRSGYTHIEHEDEYRV